MSISRSFRKKLIAISLFCYPHLISAAVFNWTGGTSDLNDACNWDNDCFGGVPGNGDIAVFSSTGTHTPTLTPIFIPTYFTPSVITFLSGAPSYTFTFNSSTGDTGLQMSSAAFPPGSIGNASGVVQTFNFLGTPTVPGTFFNTSYLNNIQLLDLLTFNFYDTSTMQFEGNSLVSFSTLNAFNTAQITFQNTSQSQNALINLSDSSALNFTNTAIAGFSFPGFQTTVNASNSATISFTDASDPNNAIFNLHNGSSLTFNTSIGTSGNGGPFLTLFDTSTVGLNQNISIASLNSSSKGTSVNLGTNSLTLNQPSGTQDTYAGLITGTGQLIISDADTTASLTLTQAQHPADTWKANVMEGILIGNTTNLNRMITIGSQGTVKFKQSHNGVFNKKIVGTGTLSTYGPGNLKITSNNRSFAGTTNIESGTLVLDGSLGGHINVFGTLSGTGTAAGTAEVHNGGIISPNGNKIGTLTVGNYRNDNGGVYRVNVNGAGESDLIHATTIQTNGTGKADILGGIVSVHPENNQFLVNCPYTIVTADNGVNGRYTSVSGFGPLIRPVLSYDPTHVYLLLKTNFAPFAKTHNQKSVVAQIETVKKCSPINLLLKDLADLTPAELRKALNELSGEQYTALIPTLQKTNQRFIRSINLPIRLNMYDPCECECQYEGCWADIQYGKSISKNDSNAEGYSVKIIDAFIATQMKLAPCFRAGFAVFYENDLFNFNLSGNAHTNTALGSFFGVYQTDSFYLLGDLLFGYSFNKVKRHIDFDVFDESTKSEPKIYDAGFYAEIGTNFTCLPCLLIQPFAAAEIDYLYQVHFKENGGGFADLKAKNHEYKVYDTFIGLRSKGIFGGLEVIAEAAWQHRYNNDFNSIDLQFDQFGNQFKVLGPKQGRNGLSGSVLLALNAMDNRKVFAEAYGERWDNYSDYGFSVGFDINW